MIVGLSGCATAQVPATQQLSGQYKDKSIDQLVVAYGPPASTFAMTNGDKMHEWQLPAGTDGNGNAVQCKIRAVANPQGVVRTVSTNDQEAGTGNTWCSHALSGNLANVQNDDAAAEAVVDTAVGTAILGAILF
jgi:hypothetical protein